MWSPNRNSNVISFEGIDVFLFWVVWVLWNMEAYHAFGGEESLVVHLMPMGNWTVRVRRKNAFYRTKALCCQNV